MLDELIASSPVFEGLSADDLTLIAGCGKNTGFEAGQQFAREGDPADTFFLIRHGRVALELHTPVSGSSSSTRSAASMSPAIAATTERTCSKPVAIRNVGARP